VPTRSPRFRRAQPAPRSARSGRPTRRGPRLAARV